MKQLTIISHTEHYRTENGELVGFGATVTEINHLLEVFDNIVHVAVLHDGMAPDSALPYVSNQITFVALPVVGGKTITDKADVILKAPRILYIINKALRESTHFQFRAPTGIGVYVIPYLIFFSSRKGWFKYAGNWMQEHAPLAYRFQRWLLKLQNRVVTINGHWHNQPHHCLSFENPCLTQNELQQGNLIRKTKVLPNRKSFCFVGRLDASKGMELFIDSLIALSEYNKNLIDTIHIIGPGANGDMYKQRLESSGISSIYHGTLSRKPLHCIYEKCQFIVLPSKSEGFPKVISEALNYGCVPVVSNVSAIGQYIQDGVQGFVIKEISLEGLKYKLQECLNLEEIAYRHMITQPHDYYNRFTYSFYNNRIRREILEKE
jgi:glycosyltransferase involved in cell wall biosynthesis